MNLARWLGDLLFGKPFNTAWLTNLDKAQAEENERQRIRQAEHVLAFTPDPVRIVVEEIKPGTPAALFNAADHHCERCGGVGRLSQCDPDGTVRAWVPCPCTAGRDHYGEPLR